MPAPGDVTVSSEPSPIETVTTDDVTTALPDPAVGKEQDLYDDEERELLAFIADGLLDDSVPSGVPVTVSRGQYGYAIGLTDPGMLLFASPAELAEGVFLIRLDGPFEQPFAVPLVEQFAEPERGRVAHKTVSSAFYVVDASDGRVVSGTSFFETDPQDQSVSSGGPIAPGEIDVTHESDSVTLALAALAKT